MYKILKSNDRGRTQIDWLDSYHSFSFADYFNPEYHNFGALRVINEDFVEAGQGFDPHPHRDMEIITYVLEGSISHKDSLGNGSIIKKGDVQIMSAGTGIRHSEFNPSAIEKLHLLQIWIMPKEKNINPSYEQKEFSDKRANGKLTLIASSNGAEGSVTIHQDAKIYVLDLAKDQEYNFDLPKDKMLWVQVARGSVAINDEPLEQGDAMSIESPAAVQVRAQLDSELLLFVLADK